MLALVEHGADEVDAWLGAVDGVLAPTTESTPVEESFVRTLDASLDPIAGRGPAWRSGSRGGWLSKTQAASFLDRTQLLHGYSRLHLILRRRQVAHDLLVPLLVS